MPYKENSGLVEPTYLSKSYLMDAYPGLIDSSKMAGLWVWGENASGQLGDNTVGYKSSPIQTVSGGANWKIIGSAGNAWHNAAIKTNGTLWLWGKNDYGQMGTNDRTPRSSPIQTIAGGTNWKSVSCGGSHTTAIKTDGTLWAWGENASGQLGVLDRTPRSSPVQIIAGGTWAQVSCSLWTVGGIKTDGTLWMWGTNSYGSLGIGTTTGNRSSPVQTVAGGNNWKQVSCGLAHAAAIKTNGELWNWGENSLGELAREDQVDRSSPIQTIAAGTNWKLVSCGAAGNTAAIKTNGELWGWGANAQGQLGTNDRTPRSSPVQTVSGGTNWKSVSCGFGATAAIKTNGEVWVWGLNASGQLGMGDRTPRSSPVQIIAGGTNWKQIVVGYVHTTAIKDFNEDF
jgi:alpha-tubulin suppressor-like RCC1 family protein